MNFSLIPGMNIPPWMPYQYESKNRTQRHCIQLCELSFEDFFWDESLEKNVEIEKIQSGERVADDRYYAFSGLNARDKFSENYVNCLGTLLVGQEKDSEQCLSLLIHNMPTPLLPSWDVFKQRLTQQVQAFLQKINPPTLDMVLFGGNYFPSESSLYKNFQKDYETSVQKLTQVLHKTTGQIPTVITGPNLIGEKTHAYFDTQKRRLYIHRFQQPLGVSNIPYQSSQLPEMIPRWNAYFVSHVQSVLDN